MLVVERKEDRQTRGRKNRKEGEAEGGREREGKTQKKG